MSLGGLVGGVLSALLLEVASAVELGILSGLFISCLFYMSCNVDPFVVYSVLIACLSMGLLLNYKYSAISGHMRTALILGLVFTLSIDALFDGRMATLIVDILGSISTLRLHEKSMKARHGVAYFITLWGGASLWAFISALSQTEMWKQWFDEKRSVYEYKSVETKAPAVPTADGMKAPQQRTFSYPDTLEFNFFDPDDLNEMFVPYAETVFSSVQMIAKMFGFQIDSSRNQAEHLLMLLANETRSTDTRLNDAPERLHAKFFANYRKWCNRMSTPPLFSRPEGKKFVGHITDMLFFLLVWGEAANLRHMPECLCFLYHKTIMEYIYRKDHTFNRVYPGYFLDMVVTPMYEVVAASFKGSGDHDEKKTYDDFNEFFWSIDCLQYRIFEDLEDDAESGQSHASSNPVSGNVTEEWPHVSRGMAKSKKTYLEKRSWIHSLYSLHRVFEWHIITFTLIAVLAFSVNLQWSYSYTLQIASVVFWMASGMGIVWTSLEVWTLYPSTDISLYTVAGYVLRILGGYVVFTYQSVYFQWSFASDASGGTTSGQVANAELQLNSVAGANYWWWQYFWLSLCAMSFSLVEFVACYFPIVVSTLMTWENDYFQALLNICYPLSQLYVGKTMHVTTKEAFKYIAFWLSLIAFKFYFAYTCVISPICGPSVELYDDYMNFQRTSLFKTCLLMFILWVPHLLVYLIDMSIWYAVWSSGIGAVVALVERQGAVRDPSTFREHFMRSPAAFCQKIMASNSYVGGALQRNISTASITNLSGKFKALPMDPERLMVDEKNSRSSFASKRSYSSADLHTTMKLGGSASDSRQGTPQQSFHGSDNDDILLGDLSEFLDKRSMRWVVFATAWNEIVENLRKTDHLSNAEVENLSFSHFDWLTKPVYLPLYQTAACVESTVHMFKEAAILFRSEAVPQAKLLALERFKADLDVTTLEAVGEFYELTSFVLTSLLGPQHMIDIRFILDKLFEWAENDEIFVKVDPTKVSAILGSLENISATLKECISTRKKAPVVTEELLVKLKAAEKAAKRAAQEAGTLDMSPTRDMSGNGMRRSVSTGFLAGVDSNADSSTDLNFSVTNGSSHHRGRKFEKLQPFRKQLALMDHTRDKVRDDLRSLFGNIRSALTSQQEDLASKDIKDRLIFLASLENGFMWDDVYGSTQIDDMARDLRMQGVLCKLHGLLKLRKTEVDPVSAEATRRLHFFINSLFMEMPTVPSMRYCREYTCMTPFYAEDVLLTRSDLESKNSDGITTLLYLQTLYRQDWINFCERRNIKDDSDLQVLWSPKNLLEVRMWASYRAQTLFRTVEGIMYTEAAIRLLCELEKLYDEEINTLAPLKFNYVIACQVYGQQRKKMEHKADDIDFLLLRHPNLRVAYIDSLRSHHDGETSFYSVLIKHDFQNDLEPEFAIKSQHAKGGYAGLSLNSKEVYRVKLPGNAVLGEGKPENQNNAIIFSRGRFVQAMDMNQDGYFEEAFKMRNLLEEFDADTAIVGFREHIFTGSVSSVANYMALQELSFVTLGQRVLYNPLRIRQHYGHPDLFNKFFIMTEGGMSKASTGINLSEDVFAGFNATIRGHAIKFKEYVYAGKGRDVGLQQTYKFEAKLSQGNAEQSLTRDMSRICRRLDFFRLMSFYYGGIGHYLANTMVMFTLVIVVYFMVGLAVFNEEGINGRKMVPEGWLQILVSGMGILQTLPLFVTLTVEKGLFIACREIFAMIISGGPLYFIFHIQTKAYFFSQTLLAGGAMYRPTGRGFVTRHSPFDENYRFFANSHIYLGFDLLIALIVFKTYSKTTQYFALTWTLWMAAIAFLIGPFWFNPITFEWDTVSVDYAKWSRWMAETGGTSEQSWETWWKEENAFYNKTTPSWKIFLILQKSLPWAVISLGLFGLDFVTDSRGQFRLLELLVLFLAYFLLSWVFSKLQRNLTYATRRFSTLILNSAMLLCLLSLFVQHQLYVRFSVALYYLLAAVTFIVLLWAPGPLVLTIYKTHDYIVGHTLFLILGVMSTLQMGHLQTWLLYHNALSAGVAIEDVLKFARKNKEMGKSETVDQVNELKAQVLEQERLIKNIVHDMNAEASPAGKSSVVNNDLTGMPVSAVENLKFSDRAYNVNVSSMSALTAAAFAINYGSTDASESLATKTLKLSEGNVNQLTELSPMSSSSAASSSKRMPLISPLSNMLSVTSSSSSAATASASNAAGSVGSRNPPKPLCGSEALPPSPTNPTGAQFFDASRNKDATSSKSSLSSIDSEKAFAASFAGEFSKKPPPRDFTFFQPTEVPPPLESQHLPK